jgi:hypothetical protein
MQQARYVAHNRGAPSTQLTLQLCYGGEWWAWLLREHTGTSEQLMEGDVQQCAACQTRGYVTEMQAAFKLVLQALHVPASMLCHDC